MQLTFFKKIGQVIGLLGLLAGLVMFVFFSEVALRKTKILIQTADPNLLDVKKLFPSVAPSVAPAQVTKTKSKACYPGCIRSPVNGNFVCSLESMYRGGKDGGLCDNVTGCSFTNPMCCCYDKKLRRLF